MIMNSFYIVNDNSYQQQNIGFIILASSHDHLLSNQKSTTLVKWLFAASAPIILWGVRAKTKHPIRTPYVSPVDWIHSKSFYFLLNNQDHLLSTRHLSTTLDIHTWFISVISYVRSASECCLTLTLKLLQLYHGENNLIFYEIMRSLLY